jgi:N-acetylglucosaminyl-diphospho-decaprenol L-rhamnosyltransferase
MELSIIIVNWNSKDYLRQCLASLQRETPELAAEIVVIDSASYDGAGEMLQKEFPAVRFIQSDKNLGFARANNAAFAASHGRYVLFLNPDTEVVGRALPDLLTALKTLPQAGAVGGKLLNTDGSVQTSCIQSVPTILNQLLDSEFLRARWPKSGLWGMAALFCHDPKPQPVEAISGACVMLKREVFEQVGRFSEDYFMYAEDIDLSAKVARAGWRNYYVPNAVVVHHGGGSSAGAVSQFSTVMMREAIWRFLRKTRGAVYGFGYRLTTLLAALVRLLFLALLFPVQILRRRRESWQASFQKWRAVLRWSLNRDETVRQFH